MPRVRFYLGLIVFALSLPSHGVQFSSILPANRSVQVGTPASFFGTILNTSSVDVEGCAIFLASPIDAWFSYQATNSETNAPIGVINTPVNIPANSSQSFVLLLTPNSVIAQTDVRFTYSCNGERDIADIDGINTLLFSATIQPVPDVITLAQTISANGIVELVQGETGFFTLSTTNLGANGTVEVTPRVTGAERINASICQTDPNNSTCLSAPQPKMNLAIEAGETSTFALFLTTADLIELDPAKHRIFVEFRDVMGVIRGSTSVAVSSSPNANLQPAPTPEPGDERTISITWNAPEPNNAQPATYGIHFGTQSGVYTNSVFVNPEENAKNITVSVGELYVAMTAQSASGDRSEYSPELEIQIR